MAGGPNNKFLNMNVLYTVLLGDKDDLKPPRIITPGWDYVAFVDREHDCPGWQQRIVSAQDDPKKESRRYKCLPHIYLPQYTTSIYIDATCTVRANLNEFVGVRDSGVWFDTHPQRQSVYEEGQIAIDKKLDDPKTIEDQLNRYRAEGFPGDSLYRGARILRIGDCKKFNEVWWGEIWLSSWRDQISAPYAAWKTNTKVNFFEHGESYLSFPLSLHNPRNISSDIFHCKTKQEISEVSKEAWVVWGEFNNAIRAISLYPKVHVMQSSEGGLLFQRWLYDYIQDLDKFLDIVKIYGGTYVLWAE